MLNKYKTKIMLMLITLLASCAQLTWYKSTARPGDFEKDRYDCLQQSQQHVGVAQVNAYNGYAVNKDVTNDGLFRSCMNARGWSLQNKEATQAQIQQQQSANQYKAQEIKSRFDEIGKLGDSNCAKPELALYYAKSSCKANEITFGQIADNTKITANEKVVLLKQRDAVEETQKKWMQVQIDEFGTIGRKRVDLANSTLRPENDKNNLDLYNGKITWGEYNKNRKDIYLKFIEAVKNIR